MMIIIPSDFGLSFGWVEEEEEDAKRFASDVQVEMDGERKRRKDAAVRPRESPSRGHS